MVKRLMDWLVPASTWRRFGAVKYLQLDDGRWLLWLWVLAQLESWCPPDTAYVYRPEQTMMVPAEAIEWRDPIHLQPWVFEVCPVARPR